MNQKASQGRTLQARTARIPSDAEQKYVIAQGAPMHYVDGYGLVGAGAIVSLATGVTPGKWMVEVSPEDADKAGSSESDATRLAVLAAAKIKARGNSGDVERKRALDKEAEAAAAADAQAAAQREADAIAKAADAEAAARAEKDRAEQERDRADELQRQLDASNAELAKLQAEKSAEGDKGTAKAGK